uniref:Uncharacterized protein n=2 Tax=Avena sativa TaxID=4498 RepID=A0ACD5TSS7_AVESA
MDVLLLEKAAVLGLFAAAMVLAISVAKFSGKRFRLPPGPFAAPIVGNWLQVGDDLNHRKLMGMAKRFGEVFLLRMGVRNLVVVSSPELAKEVLHTQGVEFGSRSRNLVMDVFTGKGQDMVFASYGDHWRKMRRIMTVPFFTSKVVAQSRAGWEEEARLVVEDLKADPAAATEGVVLWRSLQLMMYNDVFRVMFGRRFDTADDPLFREINALNVERSRLSQSFDFNYGDFIPVLRPFLRRYLDRCAKLNNRRMRIFEEHFVQQRMKALDQSGGETLCAMDHVLMAERKGEINHDNVLYIVENINIAGIEGTLWSIEWGIVELVNNPEVQSKLRHEMAAVLGPNRPPLTVPDLKHLPYLQSVVKETLRLRMAITMLVPHMNLQDAKLGGFDIPAHSKILVNAWFLANDPKRWVRADEFRPERFLEEEKDVEANGNDLRFVPFGVGRRSCPGIILALPIMAITLGRLVQNFQLLPPPGKDKIDTTAKLGQFSSQILNHATIVCKPLHQA